MRRIYPGSITSYSQFGHLKVPKSVKAVCPECRKKVDFVLKSTYQSSKHGLMTESSCPSCKHSAPFIIIMKEREEHPDVYIYDPKTMTHPLNQIEQLPRIPEELVRAYKSAVNVHQSKENSATAVLAKRVIENILKHFLSEQGRGLTLEQQFKVLPEHIDLVKPVSSLSPLLASDGALHQMLELEMDLDDEMAELIMDLLEDLIQYLFVLPGKIEITHNLIEKKLD
ncbi:hypothetical protein [Mesobacillus subterraneus]|uniref:DUF4145 domain-containing protein n=1 Tax=Mesobacillus subterraneus TaxID=285983 RepID=A0A427TMI4_9BACI|nr:hypothetical protein [Mesobacillus subterraneus]RSD25563.1 hypothetical protein EJA10_17330 [Mesobacillus subterraneus]